jgi:hypothetical protein
LGRERKGEERKGKERKGKPLSRIYVNPAEPRNVSQLLILFEKGVSTHRKITKMTTKRLEKLLERVENGEQVEAPFAS